MRELPEPIDVLMPVWNQLVVPEQFMEVNVNSSPAHTSELEVEMLGDDGGVTTVMVLVALMGLTQPDVGFVHVAE